tara:strand:+ start:258 stop:419 length:162 start_codon:yes stop_codon:yes gene_type:complete
MHNEYFTIALNKLDLDRLFVVLDDAIPYVRNPEDKSALNALKLLVMRADDKEN